MDSRLLLPTTLHLAKPDDCVYTGAVDGGNTREEPGCTRGGDTGLNNVGGRGAVLPATIIARAGDGGNNGGGRNDHYSGGGS